jgi:hypothetical protein
LTNTAIPAAIRTLSGSGQHATVNTVYSKPLEVRVTDAAGKPVTGITVVFELPGSAAGGTFAGSAGVVTNALGVATAPALTANTTAGSFTINAWVAGVRVPARFNLTNKADQPASVNVFAGNFQHAFIAKPYQDHLQAQVVDQFGNPVAGVKVTFTAPSTGASGFFAGKRRPTATTAITNGNGVATAPIFTANARPGSFNVTASISGASTFFSLRNLIRPRPRL